MQRRSIDKQSSPPGSSCFRPYMTRDRELLLLLLLRWRRVTPTHIGEKSCAVPLGTVVNGRLIFVRFGWLPKTRPWRIRSSLNSHKSLKKTPFPWHRSPDEWVANPSVFPPGPPPSGRGGAPTTHRAKQIERRRKPENRGWEVYHRLLSPGPRSNVASQPRDSTWRQDGVTSSSGTSDWKRSIACWPTGYDVLFRFHISRVTSCSESSSDQSLRHWLT